MEGAGCLKVSLLVKRDGAPEEKKKMLVSDCLSKSLKTTHVYVQAAQSSHGSSNFEGSLRGGSNYEGNKGGGYKVMIEQPSRRRRERSEESTKHQTSEIAVYFPFPAKNQHCPQSYPNLNHVVIIVT